MEGRKGEKIMDMMLNSLPSRTWNRLGINESFIRIEGTLTPRLPEIVSGNPALRSQKDKFSVPMSTGMGSDMDTLTETASLTVLEIPADTSIQEPVILKLNCENDEKSVSRLYFHAAEGSCASVILLLQSSGFSDGGINAVQTKILAEKNSHIKFCVVQLLGTDFVCLHDIGAVCQDNASFELVKLELGAGKTYAGVEADLKGRESSFQTDVAYHVCSGQKLDMNYNAVHHGVKTNSLMTVSGTLEEDARKVFRGTIDFKQGSQGAKGTENENVLLLGENMVNQTIPLILCKEEDVEGNHGASIGQLDEKVLFYLGTRGISREAAQQMIAQSRIDAVCAMVPSEEIQTAVHHFEEERRNSYADGK